MINVLLTLLVFLSPVFTKMALYSEASDQDLYVNRWTLVSRDVCSSLKTIYKLNHKFNLCYGLGNKNPNLNIF